eukprot:CAMPEP_0119035618 /NCGR_PEP_ID=MMETSP1177-20130426/2755_1 /TAXON_ID=2985 /ORGANISM="Ochromonas sp, Strain CCMP1899" /LENGTH=563 /DNA_ID=CAMNT_0006994141 /DNA_START=164 /DNA_END=1855 /DNA_ORIENTATION=+
MSDHLERQKRDARLSRSASVGVDMVPSELNPVLTGGRRALYGTLPFVAAFGMQHRESAIRRVLSTASFDALHSFDMTEYEHAELLSGIDVDEIIITFPLIMASFVAIIAQFMLGYNTAVMNAPSAVVFPGHTTWLWSIAVSAFAIGGPGGAVLGGYLANKRGRSGAMMVNTWIFFVGGMMMTLAPNVYWLIPARLIVGFASGLASVVVPVYLGEIAPPTLRGTLGTLTQFSSVIGILMTSLLSFPLATEANWRYLFAVTPALCALQLTISPFLLESPRWLLGKDEKSAEARVVIKQMRGFRHDGDVEHEVQHFLFAASKHKTPRESAHSGGAMYDLLQAKDTRVLVVSAIVLQMGNQLCGINAVFYYSTTFFEGLISDPLVGTTLVAFVNVVATYVALKLMDTTQRRTLILISTGGMIVATGFIIASLSGLLPNYVALFAIMTFVSFYEIGLGPIPWLIVAEMFDAKYVATAMSLACIVNWGCNFLVGLCFPFIQQALGAWSFGPFGLVLIITFIFTLCYLPETHGRSVQEIHQMVRGGDDEVRNAKHIIQAVESYDLSVDEF